MQDKLYNTTIALAGVVQAVSLAQELAQSGKMDEAAFETSIYSIFQTDPPDLPAVYNGIKGIKLGLQQLIVLLDPSSKSMQTRYMLSLLHLQKKISRSPKLLQKLGKRIEQAKKQVSYFSLTHPLVIGNLADIYLEAISTLKFRIIIWGNQRILTAADNMQKIRALFLAGVRSSVLWRQMGGSRTQLIFSRAKIRGMANKILTDL